PFDGVFEKLVVDGFLVGKNVMSYDGQDDDVCEDISMLNACANVLTVEKDDVDFFINKTIFNFGFDMKNEGCKGIKE
ncbi:hypothetical protein Csa_011895, partial [Cucumis sativus]